MNRIESLLTARLFLAPQSVGNRIFFISNLSGHMSLYAMDHGGSIPEPLLPPQIALQNPTLMNGMSYKVFPGLDKILVMIDQDGDEVYQPMLVPVEGGYPEPILSNIFADHQVNLLHTDLDENIAYLWAASRKEPINRSYRLKLESMELVKVGESMYGGLPAGANESHNKFITMEAYGAGDHVIHFKENPEDDGRLLFGVPMSEREPGQEFPPNSISECFFVDDDQAIIFYTSLFSDTYGIGSLKLDGSEAPKSVKIIGTVHEGTGELEELQHLHENTYLVSYNIDGCSWLYEGSFDLPSLTLKLDHVLCGQGELSGGILKGYTYDKTSDRYALSFTTATSPAQIYTIEGADRSRLVCHTQERVLGIPDGVLSPGEDASFTSYDGLRVSARLYLPDKSLGFEGPRPLIYYVHGGPQSQEHPDFTWFSMPLIQMLTLSGFAVFVPNVRGSTGYGFAYMKHVVKDWGGADRLDHVHAMREVLPKDRRIDTSRTGVVGRSYGGFMTLTLAGRHPELWSAACDMFGPYDLLTFADRVPETWKPLIALLIGEPTKDRDFMVERSPRTYIHQIQCPLLVIQGKNDPRVIEQESRELVEELRSMGKEVEYLMFENEGHDVLKFENRVRCYNAIVGLFVQHLKPS